MSRVGETVRLHPNHCNPEERETLYRVVEDNGDRLIISPAKWDWPIVPQELVRAYMVQPA